MTVTDVWLVTDPLELVAVKVYVVVCVGETETEVPVTGPIPEMEREVAPVVVQKRVALWPAAMDAVLAEKAEMVGAWICTGLTVTVTFWLAVPPLPVAVRV